MEFFITLISLSLSLIAAFISSATLWLTLLKRGRLICLRPQSFNIGRYSSRDTSAPYQILLRQLFIATTGPKLFFIEQLYIELRRSTSVQQFNIWVYGKQKDLVRGSGVKIGHDGLNADHYFLLSKNIKSYAFDSGNYKLELYAKLWGRKDAIVLTECSFAINTEQSRALTSGKQSLNFDWNNEEKNYTPSFGEQYEDDRSHLLAQ